MAELGPRAKKLLKYFKDKGLGEKDFETPVTLRALFDDPAEYEAAYQELESLGLLSLAPPLPPYPAPVRPLRLTSRGVRYLQSNELD